MNHGAGKAHELLVNIRGTDATVAAESSRCNHLNIDWVFFSCKFGCCCWYGKQKQTTNEATWAGVQTDNEICVATRRTRRTTITKGNDAVKRATCGQKRQHNNNNNEPKQATIMLDRHGHKSDNAFAVDHHSQCKQKPEPEGVGVGEKSRG